MRPLLAALLVWAGCSASSDSHAAGDAGDVRGADAQVDEGRDSTASAPDLLGSDGPSPSDDAGGPAGSTCSASNGTLSLSAKVTRTTGISPLLVFFDATTTTDTAVAANMTAFQDVHYSWSFGDTGASGTAAWPYGANPGKNAKNGATGAIAAHLYVTSGKDTTYTATVTAANGTSTASCKVGVTVTDADNGFAGDKTTCVSSSGTPAAGAGGCPAGAAVLSTTSFNTALGATYVGSGKRVLFKCGDTFTGDNATVGGTTWSIGAYGGCEGTGTKRPIFADTSTNYHVDVSTTAGDGRIADIDFESKGTSAGAVAMGGAVNGGVPYQITLDNLLSNGNKAGYYWGQGAQCGIVGSVQASSGGSIAVFINSNENNPGMYTGSVFPNIDYQAVLGDHFVGVGVSGMGAGIETLRISACRMCVIENSDIENSNNVGSNLKLHNGNTNGSLATWSGVYTELIEISDNLFGMNGGAGPEIAPQNAGDDERIRNIVFERNVVATLPTSQGERLGYVSGQNITVRDNAFYMTSSASAYQIVAMQVITRGNNNFPYPSQYNEVYNNTCYTANPQGGQECIGFDALGGVSPTTKSVAKNNLFYTPASSGHVVVDDTGTGNTVSNNTVMTTNDPGFTNASGTFLVLSDYRPTASYAGGVMVPVLDDALGIPWAPTWELGAVHH